MHQYVSRSTLLNACVLKLYVCCHCPTGCINCMCVATARRGASIWLWWGDVTVCCHCQTGRVNKAVVGQLVTVSNIIRLQNNISGIIIIIPEYYYPTIVYILTPSSIQLCYIFI